MIDAQEFGTITCQIEAPALVDLVIETRKELKDASFVGLSADFSTFKIIVENEKPLRFEKPRFDVSLLSTEDLDVKKAKEGIEKIKEGFDQEVEKVLSDIRERFPARTSLKKSDLLLKEFRKTKKGFVAKFHQFESNIDVESELKGNVYSYEGVERGGKMKTFVTTKYKTERNKLLQTHETYKVVLPDEKMVISSSIEYQKIGDVVFPKRIQSSVKAEAQKKKYEWQRDARFTGCKKMGSRKAKSTSKKKS